MATKITNDNSGIGPVKLRKTTTTGEKTPEEAGTAPPSEFVPVSGPSEQQDINKILEPYMNELLNLGPEYGAEMSYLAPYLSPQNQQAMGIEQSVAKSLGGSGVQAPNESSAANQALNTTGTALEESIEGQQPPGFGKLADAGKEYENSLLYTQPLQAGLAYQKYLETYGGLQPNTASWTPQAQEAYKSIMGSGGSSGLPSPTVVGADTNAQQQANSLLTQNAAGSSTGGGNAS